MNNFKTQLEEKSNNSQKVGAEESFGDLLNLSDSPRGFKTQLEDIEKEMEIINDPNKKDISWSEFIEYKQLEARKSQLIKDEEIHKQEIKEFVKELKFKVLYVVDYDTTQLIAGEIDKLSKEMIGEEKEK